MDYTRVPDAQGNKADKRPTDSTPNPTKNDNRPFRRVRSPSRPRAWLSSSQFHKPRFSRDDRSFHKAGFSNYRYHHLKPKAYFNRRDYPPPKPRHIAPNKREKEKVREKEEERGNEWYGQRESTDGSSPSKQSNTSRAVIPWATSSRDEDIQITVFQDERIQSSERDHRSSKSKSKDRERSRDGELPLTASQMAARDRAIQQKRREIDEVYYQECEIFGLVAKMLIAKDPSLERPIQSSLQENLRDIGTRCVEAMEKFIEDYDSRELLHFSDQ